MSRSTAALWRIVPLSLLMLLAFVWPTAALATGFANGGFESDAIGASPPTSWLRQTYLNGGVSGTAAAPLPRAACRKRPCS